VSLPTLLLIAVCCGVSLVSATGSVSQDSSQDTSQKNADRDGQRDFDFHTGTWTTRLKRLRNPLTGSTTWVEYEGTTTVRTLLGGRANVVELDVKGPSGRIEGLSLRLYNPRAQQWSLHYANAADGLLTVPVIGAFSQGRGEFYGQDTLDGKAILVRFVISDITPDSCHFEQAFSADGGKTWEVNWIATDTRRPAQGMDPDSLVRRLYALLSGAAGQRDWTSFASLFHEKAVMGAIVTDAQGKQAYQQFTPAEYVQRNDQFFRTQAFHVEEIHRVTEQFGEIVHLFSTYRYRVASGGLPQGAGPRPPRALVQQEGRGINSIQLIRDADRWWILSIQYTNERPDLTVPAKYLGKGRVAAVDR
jgi:hypothetical protein